jgi:hypothetical protein
VNATDAVLALLAVMDNRDIDEIRELLALRDVIAVLAHDAVPADGAYKVVPANEVNDDVNAHEAEVALAKSSQIG